jgi:hypothetical protein
LNKIEDFLTNKKMKTLTNEDGIPVLFYHGTNRKFDQHSLSKNRTILNDEYQGDWICYSLSEDIAWDYTHAARNQNIDKEVFFQELDVVFKDTKGTSFLPHFVNLTKKIINEDYSESWEKAFAEYAEERGFEKDDAPKNFIMELDRFQKINNFDSNDFFDCMEFIEGSKSGEIDGLEGVFNIFNASVSELPYHVIECLSEIGFKKSIPESRVMVSEIQASKILETSNREEAKLAKDNGYDLVIYSGEGTVKGVTEYLVLCPSQIKIKEIIVEDEMFKNTCNNETISETKRIRKKI